VGWGELEGGGGHGGGGRRGVGEVVGDRGREGGLRARESGGGWIMDERGVERIKGEGGPLNPVGLIEGRKEGTSISERITKGVESCGGSAYLSLRARGGACFLLRKKADNSSMFWSRGQVFGSM